jgi:glucose-6-phosphate 1-dehydrogenase
LLTAIENGLLSSNSAHDEQPDTNAIDAPERFLHTREDMPMRGRTPPSDALVLFGVTGDLAHKMIFPALYAMVKRGTLRVPVIGVASSPWTLEDLRKRATDSVNCSVGSTDRRTLARLLSLLKYVRGDYNDPATFAALKQALGKATRPAHYLAIPPQLFAIWRRHVSSTP